MLRKKKLTILLHRYEHATKIESSSFEKNRFKTHANKQQINQTENFHAKKKLLAQITQIKITYFKT